MANPTAAASGNRLTLTVPISFTSLSAGTQSISAYVSDYNGATSGWVPDGSWTVTAPATGPIPAGTPLAGSSIAGVQQTITASYGDPNGVASIDAADLLIGNCRVTYEFGAFWLLNDAQNALLGPLYPGSGTVANSSCTLTNPAASASGTQLTLSLPLTFANAMIGTQSVLAYISDQSGANSGWVPYGTWTISASPPPTLDFTVSVGSLTVQRPASGTQIVNMPITVTATTNASGTVSFTAFAQSKYDSMNVAFYSSGIGLGGISSVTLSGLNSSVTAVVPVTLSAGSYYKDPSGYTVSVTATAGSVTHGATGQLNIGTTPLSVTCSASPASAMVGQTVSFAAYASGGTGSYGWYSWSGAVAASSAPAYFTPSAAGTYVEYVTVMDSGGKTASGSCSVTVTGPTQQTVSTFPSGIPLIVDSVSCTAPCTFNWSAGTSHTISAPSTQTDTSGSQIAFSQWSDGGAQSHSITVGAAAANIIASFRGATPQVARRAQAQAGLAYYLLNDGAARTWAYCLAIRWFGQLICDPYDYDASNISNLNASKSGVSAAFAGSPSKQFPSDNSTYDVTFTAGPSTTPGTADFSFIAYGTAVTQSPAVQVYDATPVITGIQQFAPPYPGGPFSVQITGNNLGAAGSVTLCALEPSTTPCSQTGDFPTIQIGSWSITVALVTLTPSASASGLYCIQVTSLGATGKGFNPAPGISTDTSACAAGIDPEAFYTISGTITSASTGKAMPGKMVKAYVNGNLTPRTTTTDASGMYSFMVEPGDRIAIQP